MAEIQPNLANITDLPTLVGLLSIPTFTMMLGGLIVFKYHVGTKLIAALQHFASGILVGAIGWELTPEIETASKSEILALVIGFFLGVCFLLFVGRFDFRHWKSCSQKQNFDREEAHNLISDEEGSDKPVQKGISEYHSVNDTSDILLEKNQVPIGLVLAVLVDGSIDGLLIGISSLSSVGTGLVTAIALSIEMALLGVSTCNTLRKSTLSITSILALCLTLPLSILIAGLIGASLLQGTEGPVLIGTIAFGGAGLLYLVTEELMIEAHEDEETDRWWVTIMFFVGFMVVILLDKFLPGYL